MHYQFIETESADDFTRRGVEFLSHHIRRAMDDHGTCIIGLSGGSMPRPVYETLGKEDLDWSRVSIFLIDERHIDSSSSDSNQKLVRDTLLKHAMIPEDNIVFPDTTLPIHDCVKKYGEDLKRQWKNRLPDIAVLGMGDDGHIASLFPPLQDAWMSDEALVFHTTTPSASSGQATRFAVHDRITLSLNAVCAPETRLFLLKGADKKRVWDAMMTSGENERRWPAKRVIETGDVTVLWAA